MKLVTTTGDYIRTRNEPGLHVDVVDTMKMIKSAGYDGIDLNIACYSHGADTRPLETDGWKQWADRVKQASEELEIPIEQAHAPFLNPCPEHELSDWEKEMNERTLYCCELLRIPVIVYHTWIVQEGRSISSVASREKTLRTIRDFAIKYAAFGTKIAVENNVPYYNYFSSPEDLISLVDEIDMPNVGICWDFGHGNLSKLDTGAALRKIGRRLIAVHANDNHAHGEFDEHLLPFCGTVNWEDGMRALSDIGYKGNLTFEAIQFYPGMPEALVPEAMKFAEKTGRYLISLAEK